MAKNKRRVYQHFFGSVPGTVESSTPVRYWNEGLLVFLLILCAAYPLSLFATQLIPNPTPLPFGMLLSGSLLTTFDVFALGGYKNAALSEFLRVVRTETVHPWVIYLQIGSAWGVALSLSWFASRSAFKPRNNERDISGPRLLKDKEAVSEMHYRCLSLKEQQTDPHSVLIHPELVISKKQASRHVLVVGSPGSGKSVIMSQTIRHAIKKNQKCFIYDVKGTYTSIFRQPIIVCPFDGRSYVWDVAKDVDTPIKAEVFAASIINDPGSDKGNFWILAARSLLVGAIKELQATKPLAWGFADLAASINRSQEEWVVTMMTWHKQATNLVAGGGETVQSIQATLAGLSRMINDLATAWPTVGKRRFAMSEWIKDGYEGRKQVIVQAGPDAGLTAAYIGALINCAVPEILSPSLPDNEEGRFLGFFFDELTSIARLNIDGLFEMGRSKGVVAYIGFQDFMQVQRVYGDKEAATLQSMIGTHIACQIQPSETRDLISQRFGKKKVSWFSHQDKAVVHEESRNVVSPHDLTAELGPVKNKKIKPDGFGVRAIVSISGWDPMLLLFPGRKYPKRREGQVEAKWMREVAKPNVPAPKIEVIAGDNGEGYSVETIKEADTPAQEGAPFSVASILEKHLKRNGARDVVRVKIDKPPIGDENPFGFD